MERCKVCGKPKVITTWSGLYFNYCSFACQAYAWRFVSLPLIVFCLVWIIINKSIFSLLGLILLIFYAMSGFTAEINHRNGNNAPLSKVKDIHPKDMLSCLQCGYNLTIDDKFCQYCGKSTDEELLTYFSRKFNQEKLFK